MTLCLLLRPQWHLQFVHFEYWDVSGLLLEASCPCHVVPCFLFSGLRHRRPTDEGTDPRTGGAPSREPSSQSHGRGVAMPLAAALRARGVVARGPLHYHAFARGLLHHMNFRLFHITAWLRSAPAPCPGPDKPSTQQSTTYRRHLGRVLLCMELGSTQGSGGAFNLLFQRLQ